MSNVNRVYIAAARAVTRPRDVGHGHPRARTERKETCELRVFEGGSRDDVWDGWAGQLRRRRESFSGRFLEDRDGKRLDEMVDMPHK